MGIIQFLAAAFGVLGIVTSVMLFLSPLRTFIAIRRNESVGEFSPMPYLAALLNSAVWLLYGLVHPYSTSVVIVNSIGVVIESAYVAFFGYYCQGVAQLKVILSVAVESIFVGSVAALVFGLAQSPEGKFWAFGVVGVGTNILMYASPLFDVIAAFRTTSVEHMDQSMYVALLVNAICWTIYAVVSWDLFVLIPNLLGVVFAGVLLVVYAKFSDNHGC